MAIRNLATIVYRLGGGKESIDRIWPLDGLKKEPLVITMTKEKWDKIKQQQIPIDKKIADARLKNNSRR